MRHRWPLLLLCVACTGRQAAPASPAPDAPARASLAFTHVTVIDMTGAPPQPEMTVVVTGDRIAALGRTGTVSIPRGAHVVESAGRYLIPGLWDMHVHSAAAAEHDFPVYVALGITGVRNMHATADSALALTGALRGRVAAGAMLGPRFVANGPVVDGPVPAQPGSVALASAAAARAAVDSLAAGGADFIKVYLRLPRDTYFAVAAQAKQRGIPFVGHVPIAVRVEEAADAGQRSIEHYDALDWACSSEGDAVRAAFLADPAADRATYQRARAALTHGWSAERCAPAVAALRRNGTWFVPTLVVGWAPQHADAVLQDSAAGAVVTPATRARWQGGAARLSAETRAVEAAQLRGGTQLVAMLHRAGVPLLAGTDVGNPFVVPGYSLHTELALLVGAGLTPLEALQAATVNPARFLDAQDSLGTIAPGKLADLVLLDADPLASITNTRRIRAVVRGGRLLTRADLDRLLAGAASPLP